MMKITKKNLATAMLDLAGQENNDNLECDLLYDGGIYINELEQENEKLKLKLEVARKCYVDLTNSPMVDECDDLWAYCANRLLMKKFDDVFDE